MDRPSLGTTDYRILERISSLKEKGERPPYSLDQLESPTEDVRRNDLFKLEDLGFVGVVDNMVYLKRPRPNTWSKKYKSLRRNIDSMVDKLSEGESKPKPKVTITYDPYEQSSYDPRTQTVVLQRPFIQNKGVLEDFLSHELGHHYYNEVPPSGKSNVLHLEASDMQRELEAELWAAYKEGKLSSERKDGIITAFEFSELPKDKEIKCLEAAYKVIKKRRGYGELPGFKRFLRDYASGKETLSWLKR